MPPVELVAPIDHAAEPRDLLGGVVTEGGRYHLRRWLEPGGEDEGLEDRPAGEEPWGPGTGSATSLSPPQLGCPHLEGSGVAVRKWTQGTAGSRGSTDTMLPAVRNPSESTQIPLPLSRRMAMSVSAVM